jgi:hypothetical protein
MRFALALLLLPFLACNSSSPTEPSPPIEPLNESYSLRYGNSAQVTRDLRVTFAEVLEDSRCPSTVQCVWAGNGKIRLDLVTGRGTSSVVLNTTGSAEMPREASAFGYTFTLVELQPYPQTTDAIPPNQYTAVVRVKRSN